RHERPDDGDAEANPAKNALMLGEEQRNDRRPITAPALRQQADREAADEDDHDRDRDPVPACADTIAARLVGVEAGQGNRENQCDESGKRRILRQFAEIHQTFSISGRPSRPEGRKISTRTSTPKTATSL